MARPDATSSPLQPVAAPRPGVVERRSTLAQLLPAAASQGAELVTLRAAERAAALAPSMRLAAVSRDETLSMPRAPAVSRDAVALLRPAQEESLAAVALPVSAVVEPHAAAQPRWGARVRVQRRSMGAALMAPAPTGCVTECPAMGLLRQQVAAEVYPAATAMRVL